MAGIRDFLLQAQQVQGLSTQAGKDIESRQRYDAGQKLRHDLPEMVQNRDISGITGGAYAAGDPRAIDIILQNMTKPTQAKLTAEQIPSWVPEEEKQKIITAPTLDAQQLLMGSMQKDISENRQQLDAERRSREEKQKQRNLFTSRFDKEDSELREEERTIAKVKESIKLGQMPADAVVFNFLARGVAGEKGPLSNDDIRRFAARAFEGDMQKVQNFVAGGTTSVLTDEQRAAYQDLVNVAVKNFDEYRDRRTGELFARSTTDFPLLQSDDGYDKAITQRAKDRGFEVQGSAFVKKAAPRSAHHSAADLLNTANKIPDEGRRASAIRAIKSYGENEIPEEKVREFETRMKAMM